MSEIDRDSKLDRDRVIIRLSNKEIEREREREREREGGREGGSDCDYVLKR